MRPASSKPAAARGYATPCSSARAARRRARRSHAGAGDAPSLRTRDADGRDAEALGEAQRDVPYHRPQVQVLVAVEVRDLHLWPGKAHARSACQPSSTLEIRRIDAPERPRGP